MDRTALKNDRFFGDLFEKLEQFYVEIRARIVLYQERLEFWNDTVHTCFIITKTVRFKMERLAQSYHKRTVFRYLLGTKKYGTVLAKVINTKNGQNLLMVR